MDRNDLNEIKNKMYNHQEFLNTNELWNEIHPKLKTRDKKWLPFLLLFTGFTIYLVYRILIPHNPSDMLAPRIDLNKEHHENTIAAAKISFEPINKQNEAITSGLYNSTLRDKTSTSKEKNLLVSQNQDDEIILPPNARSSRLIMPLETLTNIDILAQNLIGDATTILIQKPLSMPEIQKDIFKLNKWSIAIYSGIAKPIKDLQVVNNYWGNVLKLRSEEETPIYEFSLGTRLKYAFNSSLYFSSGIEYRHILERNEYINTIHDTTYIDPSYLTKEITYSNGSKEYIYAAAEVKSTTLGIDTRYSRFKSFNLPISFGYQVSFAQCHVFFETGLTFNIRHMVSGSIRHNTYQIQKNTSFFKNNIGFAFHAAGGFSYQLNRNNSISMLFNFHSQLEDINHDENLIKQRYRSIGTTIRYERRLNW